MMPYIIWTGPGTLAENWRLSLPEVTEKVSTIYIAFNFLIVIKLFERLLLLEKCYLPCVVFKLPLFFEHIVNYYKIHR